MTGSEWRGPSVTYVTDEDLDRAAQERILNDFLACAGAHPLRVAFRLPDWTDSEVQLLVEWYSNRVDKLGLQSTLEPALVHDRPAVVDQYENCNLWLPWRNRDLISIDDSGHVAVSIHSTRDAHEAIFSGAGELVFGHVFTSESHPGQPGRGVDALLEVTEATRIYHNPPRVTTIGGINEFTIPEIGRSGHQRIACMRTISRSPNVAETLVRVRTGWVAARINAELDESQRTPFGNPSSLFF